jgi:hypothetical protein
MNNSPTYDAFSSQLSATGRIRSQPAGQTVTQLRDQPVATVYIRVVTGQPGYLPLQTERHSELCIVVVREVPVCVQVRLIYFSV